MPAPRPLYAAAAHLWPTYIRVPAFSMSRNLAFMSFGSGRWDRSLIDARVRLAVEFTQHTSDEMYRAGRGWASEWTPAEATSTV